MAARGKRVADSEIIDHPGLERWRGQTDERLDNIDDSLIRLEAAISGGIDRLNKTVGDALSRIEKAGEDKEKDFDQRIRDLENHKNWLRGGGAFAGFLAGILGSGLFQAAWPAILRALLVTTQ